MLWVGYFMMHGFGGHPFPPAALAMTGLLFGTFALAFAVHKDPPGKTLLF